MTLRSALVFGGIDADAWDDAATRDFSRLVGRASRAVAAGDISEVRAASWVAARRALDEAAAGGLTQVSYVARVETFAYGTTNNGPEAEAAIVLAEFEDDMSLAVSSNWEALVANVTGTNASSSPWLSIDEAASLEAVSATKSNFTSVRARTDDASRDWTLVYVLLALTGALGVTATTLTVVRLRTACARALKPARRIEPIIPEGKPASEYKAPSWAFD